MFITTANYLQGIPIPLQDRMEIIQLPGYTEFEKVSIAERYLIPKQKRDNGIEDVPVDFPEDAVRDVIHFYTKEAGVRNLEREIATVCRKIARDVVAKKAPVRNVSDGATPGWRITPKRLPRYLGPHRFRYGRQEGADEIGLVMGLAVTMYGGDLLATEVSIVAGKGKLVLTGKLGDVMQESAQAAISYVRARAPSLGLERDFYSRADIHVHLPEGAIPKDGPSAGITMCTGLVSALLRIPVRRDVAMTGEITLRGRVLPIGGLKEKILAAHRSGITTVIMPEGERQGPARHPEAGAEVAEGDTRRAHGRGAARGADAAQSGGVPGRAVGAGRLAPAGRAARANRSARRSVADAGRERGAAAVGARGRRGIAALRRGAGVAGAPVVEPGHQRVAVPRSGASPQRALKSLARPGSLVICAGPWARPSIRR